MNKVKINLAVRQDIIKGKTHARTDTHQLITVIINSILRMRRHAMTPFLKISVI